MNRRTFLKGLVATAAGVLVAPDVLAEPERRVFALDQTMLGRGARSSGYLVDESLLIRDVSDWIELLERFDTPLLDALERDWNYHQTMSFSWGACSHEKMLDSC